MRPPAAIHRPAAAADATLVPMPSLPSIDTLVSEPWVPGAPGSVVGGLFGRHFPAEGAARAELLLVHGYGEHHGRYARQIGALTRGGISVRAFDLPGHGRSPGRRAVVDVAGLVSVVHEVLLGVADDARPRGLPVLLMGHSMGGLLAAATAVRVPGLVDSLFLSSPGLMVGADVPAPVKALGTFLGRVVPAAPASRLDPHDVSRDEDYVEDYSADPLVFHGAVPALSGSTMIDLGTATREQAGALETPTVIIHGADDELADIRGSREFASRSAWVREANGRAPIVELVEFPGGFHELFNDLDSERAFAALDAWSAAATGVAPREGGALEES